MAVSGPRVDLLPLPAQQVLLPYLLARVLGVLHHSAQVGLGAQHAGGLAAVLVVAQLVLLLGPGGGDDLVGPPQHRHALEPVPGGGLVVGHVLVGQHHGLPGPGVGHGVPHPASGVLPGLHQVAGDGDQLINPPGAGIAHNPVVAVAVDQTAGLQHLLADEGRHGLIGPQVEQPEHPLAGDALPGVGIHEEHRQLAHGVAEDLNAAVHGGELAGEALAGLGAVRRISGGYQAVHRHRLAHRGRPGHGPDALGHTHSPPPPPRELSTAPAMASAPPAISPAGG